MYEASLRQTVSFETRRGLITRIESANTMKYALNGEGNGLVELVGESTLAPEALARLAAESEIYFAARRRNLEPSTSSDRAATEAEAAGRLDAAEAALQETATRLTLPIFTESIAQAITLDQQNRSYYLERARKRVESIGQPAADWELQDLAGRSHKLAELRGQVVVLDFWYRGCGWCIRAMPQMKQLTDDFRGQPVAIFGMNDDKEVKDAQFVADAAALNYATLRAEGIPEKYGVQVFPTLIIIGPDGKIADIHFGFSPQLRVEVGATIKRLLGGSPKAASDDKAR